MTNAVIEGGKLLLTAKETAEALNVSEKHIWRLIWAGTIPSVKLGRSVRVPSDQLQEWLRNQAGPRQAGLD
ncbi:MAG: helix-turn-helix domain-containing protein [Chloroflexota bacterium]|nr:helix-turn-helix domain-containing protein [Chloroflexota bacterium]